MFFIMFLCCCASANAGPDEAEDRCAPCAANQFRCDDAKCIENGLVCDGGADCSNGEDELEKNCVRSTTLATTESRRSGKDSNGKWNTLYCLDGWTGCFEQVLKCLSLLHSTVQPS